MSRIKFKQPFERLSNVDSCEVIQVIRVRSIVGVGDSEGTPKRQIAEYFTLDGELLARHDHLLPHPLEIGVWSEDKAGDSPMQHKVPGEPQISKRASPRQRKTLGIKEKEDEKKDNR